jgi:hypothetical protein
LPLCFSWLESLAGEESRDLSWVKHKKLEQNSINKLISLAVLAAGIVLVVFGVAATNSFSSDVSRFFTGSPTDKAIWMLIGGIVAIIIGLAVLFHELKKT